MNITTYFVTYVNDSNVGDISMDPEYSSAERLSAGVERNVVDFSMQTLMNKILTSCSRRLWTVRRWSFHCNADFNEFDNFI